MTERFPEAFSAFVEKYILDYRLKSSTAQLLRQRERRLASALDGTQVPMVTTQMLREAISTGSRFEQSKLKTLLLRFFRYAKSTGMYPSHLANPVDDLFVDPLPHKVRQRITLEQYNAIYSVAPQWLRWLMTLALHLALRRIDLVNLRFDNVVGDRIISPIRKTDTSARDIESTSVDFPIHPEVRQVLRESRSSSLRLGRCPFIIPREPDRQTKEGCRCASIGTNGASSASTSGIRVEGIRRRSRTGSETNKPFNSLAAREMPTLHEIRALSSHLYARQGYDVSDVQELMAHTDPDMARAYQKGHARKVLRVEMLLPLNVTTRTDDRVGEERAVYTTDSVDLVTPAAAPQDIFPENFLTENRRIA